MFKDEEISLDFGKSCSNNPLCVNMERLFEKWVKKLESFKPILVTSSAFDAYYSLG